LKRWRRDLRKKSFKRRCRRSKGSKMRSREKGKKSWLLRGESKRSGSKEKK